MKALERIERKFVHKEWANKPRETEEDFKIIETALKNAEDRHKRAKWANNKIEQELVSIIKEKQKSAESDLIGNHDLDKRERLKGEIEAYYDIICLIKFKYGVEK